jgi:hypothetical protein
LKLPIDHQWSEFLRNDDPIWLGVRSALVAFVAMRQPDIPKFLGTGFVIGTSEDGFLLVLTAKHVIEGGAIQVQRPYGLRVPSAPTILFEAEKPRIDPKSLRAIWMGTDHADMLFVRHVTYADNLDIALCVLEVQENLGNGIHRMAPAIALDTKIPSVGTPINIVTLSGFEISESSSDKNGTRSWKVENRPVIRVGKVITNEKESMGHKGPNFGITIPTDRGMSGGFAYVPKDGVTIAACGIISTSPEEDNGQTDFRVAGHSTIVGVMGALGLQIPVSSATNVLLFDLVKSGKVRDLAGDVGNLRIKTTGQRGACKIYRHVEK